MLKTGLMKHSGYDISEPMAFGIGSGLLFCYIPFLMVNHAPAFTYRSMPGTIFKRFAKRTGIKIKRQNDKIQIRSSLINSKICRKRCLNKSMWFQ